MDSLYVIVVVVFCSLGIAISTWFSTRILIGEITDVHNTTMRTINDILRITMKNNAGPDKPRVPSSTEEPTYKWASDERAFRKPPDLPTNSSTSPISPKRDDDGYGYV